MTGVGWHERFGFFIFLIETRCLCCLFAKERRRFDLIWCIGTRNYYYYCIANGACVEW
jgi:hypothetical protein